MVKGYLIVSLQFQAKGRLLTVVQEPKNNEKRIVPHVSKISIFKFLAFGSQRKFSIVNLKNIKMLDALYYAQMVFISPLDFQQGSFDKPLELEGGTMEGSNSDKVKKEPYVVYLPLSNGCMILQNLITNKKTSYRIANSSQIGINTDVFDFEVDLDRNKVIYACCLEGRIAYCKLFKPE
jgi:hypothetical protein